MKKVQSKLRPTEIGTIKTFSLSPKDEIGEIAVECSGCTYYYNNLAELCEKWEDYEEPKEYWYIDTYICDRNCQTEGVVEERDNFNKEIGNLFETKEEAERAVEKLKAIKRLKDKRFSFDHIRSIDGVTMNHKDLNQYTIIAYAEVGCDKDDLDLLFGGEE